MALGSFLSRLGSAALPAAISAYGTYRGGEEDERWKGLDPRTSQGLEGFMGAAQAGLSGLQRHEQEERAKKLERERAKQARIANLVGTISPRAGYRPVPVETPKAGALEQVAQLGGAGIGAYKSALEHSRGLEDRAQQQRQRELDIAEREDKKISREAELEIGALTGKLGTDLPVTKADEYATYKLTGEPPEPKVYGVEDLSAEKSPHEPGSKEDQAWNRAKNAALGAERARLLEAENIRQKIAASKASIEASKSKTRVATRKETTERIDNIATNFGSALPWGGPEDLQRHLSEVSGLTDEQIKAYMHSAIKAYDAGKNVIQGKVQGFITDAEKKAREGNYEEAVASFKAQLENEQITITPTLMGMMGDTLSRSEGVFDLSAEQQNKLGTILFLETEMKDMLGTLQDKAAFKEIEKDFGPIDKIWTSISAQYHGSEGLSQQNLAFLRRMQFSSDMIGRMQSGAALNDFEFNLYFNDLLGGIGSTPEALRTNLTTMQTTLPDGKKVFLTL